MRNNMDLGCTTGDEACPQLGENDCPRRTRRECRAFINQIIRRHGEPPNSATERHGKRGA